MEPHQYQDKPVVYISSPYTKGDPSINTKFQCEAFDVLLKDGLVLPFAPLVGSHLQQLVRPLSHKQWLDYDLSLIQAGCFAACLRLNATGPNGYIQCESVGADAEVEVFDQLGLPVFDNVSELYQWAMGLKDHQVVMSEPRPIQR